MAELPEPGPHFGEGAQVTYGGETFPAKNVRVEPDYADLGTRIELQRRAVDSIMAGESVTDWAANELEIERSARAALDYAEDYAEPTGEASWGGWFGEKREEAASNE